ncbi:hypothetical protein [Nocardioides alcanivorans]|uniref:hypothetical protein n=1 Tax=Nocardioides alcanivorans TaxID=2897352 RepID=UPI001F2D1B17|nr:hypothetical protein [Nocardioides alcanivorans]
MSDRINDMLLDQIADLLAYEPPQDAGQHPSLELHERVGAEWAEWHKRLSGLRLLLGHRLVSAAIEERRAPAYFVDPIVCPACQAKEEA